MTEEWRPAPDLEGRYEVSDLGRVHSLLRGTRTKDGMMTIQIGSGGYRTVNLTLEGGKQRTFYVHVMVARAFIGRCPSGQEVRHKDGDQSNNARTNLVYGTKKENAQDTLRHGHNANANKEKCPAGHDYSGRNNKGTRICRTCINEHQRSA